MWVVTLPQLFNKHVLLLQMQTLVSAWTYCDERESPSCTGLLTLYTVLAASNSKHRVAAKHCHRARVYFTAQAWLVITSQETSFTASLDQIQQTKWS